MTDQGPKMDPELKAKWLAALRSGQYDQTQGSLRGRPGAFCCLGVLCDVHDPNSWDDDEWFYGDGEDTDSQVAELPESFMRRARITEDVQRRLVQMNDDDGKSFAEIADYIEKHL